MMPFLKREGDDDPLFTTYTDDKDNWPDQLEPEVNEVKVKSQMVLKTIPEPVKPVQEIKLEVQKQEPVQKEKSNRTLYLRSKKIWKPINSRSNW